MEVPLKPRHDSKITKNLYWHKRKMLILKILDQLDRQNPVNAHYLSHACKADIQAVRDRLQRLNAQKIAVEMDVDRWILSSSMSDSELEGYKKHLQAEAKQRKLV